MTTARLLPHLQHHRPSDVRAVPELTALRIAYSDLRTIFSSLAESDSWRPTRCTGWAVRDLLLHLLEDVQRAVVALGTPAAGPADLDAVTYWALRPHSDVAHPAEESDRDHRDLRAQRTIASAWGLESLVRAFAETSAAVVVLAGRAAPHELVATQGHVLCVRDLLSTLVVEAAVHHLDLVVDLPRPGPRPEPLREVRHVLDELLGHETPARWSDERWAMVGTGRVPPGGAERRVLAGAPLPLLG